MNQSFYNAPEENQALPPQPSPDELSVGLSAKETRRQFSRLGLSMLVLSLGMILSQTVIDYLLFFTIPGYIESWWRVWVLSLVPLYGFGLPGMFLVLKGMPTAEHNPDFVRPGTGEVTAKTPFTAGKYLVLLVIGFGCMYIGSIIGQIIMAMLTAITGYPYENTLNSIVNESPMWMTFIGTCICAPLGEELLFRKLLIDRSRRFGDTVSILLSGFFFGLFHGNLFQFFYAFLLGMILAYIYTRTGKYLLCVLMHAVVNLMGSIVIPAIAGLIPTSTDPSAILDITPIQSLLLLLVNLWSYGSIIAGIILFIVFFRHRQLSRGSSPLVRRTAAYEVMLNPGMLANFIVMCILMVMALIPQY